MTIATPAYCSKEEKANTISHGLGALLSLIGMVMLITFAPQSDDYNLRIASFSIYGMSLILLFSASTCYHWTVNIKSKQLFKLLDHCAIYVLIAGTYTPLLLLKLEGPLSTGMLVLIWTIAVAGVCFKLKFGHKYKKISLTTYLGMGFLSLPILHKLSQLLPTGGINLLMLGGAVYTFGVIFYVKKTIPYNHAIWHLFVLGGAACHFFMIWFYV